MRAVHLRRLLVKRFVPCEARVALTYCDDDDVSVPGTVETSPTGTVPVLRGSSNHPSD